MNSIVNFFGRLFLVLGFVAGIIVGAYYIDTHGKRGPDQDGVSSWSDIDKRKVFLAKHYPQLSTVREQLVQEVEVLDGNSKKIVNLNRIFDKPEAKQYLAGKKNDIRVQRSILGGQLQKIDLETEKSLAQSVVSELDGGGIRTADLTKLVKESETMIQKAQALTLLREDWYQHEEPIVKAVPVNPTKKNKTEKLDVNNLAF